MKGVIAVASKFENPAPGWSGGFERWDQQLRHHRAIASSLLVLVTFASYGGALANGFVYDDEYQILQNPFVVNPHLWHRIFTGAVWSFRGTSIGANFYRPLQMLSYWLLYRLAGPQPALFHVIQVLIHALTVWLVYRTGSRLLGSEWAAYAGALLWAVHPLHVEAVAWIGGWPETGFGLFYILGFLLFLRAEECQQRPMAKHVLAALAYLPALFFKEMAVSFPLLLLCYFWLRPRRPASLAPRWMLRLAPYFSAVGLYLIIRRIALGSLAVSPKFWNPPAVAVEAALGLLGQHTRMFFWPAHLNPFRVFEVGPSLHSVWPWLALTGTAGALGLRKRKPMLSFLLLWWPITLLPCLDIRQLSNPLLADRFSYVPSAGLCLGVAWIAFVQLPAWAASRQQPPLRLAIPVLALLGLAALGGVATRSAVTRWHDEETLIQYSVQQSPKAASLHIVRGWILAYRFGDLDGADAEFRSALELNQHDVRPQVTIPYQADIGLGLNEYRRGHMKAAISYLEEAIALLPRHAEAYQVLGSFYFPRRDYALAASYFAKAIQFNAFNPEAHFYLGTCLAKLGHAREAASEFRVASEIDPTFAAAQTTLTRALTSKERSTSDTSAHLFQ
jgi:tetratricopeptide (TPR) repeat protein